MRVIDLIEVLKELPPYMHVLVPFDPALGEYTICTELKQGNLVLREKTDRTVFEVISGTDKGATAILLY